MVLNQAGGHATQWEAIVSIAAKVGRTRETLRCRLLQNRRAMDPERFRHLRRQLGIDMPGENAAA